MACSSSLGRHPWLQGIKAQNKGYSISTTWKQPGPPHPTLATLVPEPRFPGLRSSSPALTTAIHGVRSHSGELPVRRRAKRKRPGTACAARVSVLVPIVAVPTRSMRCERSRVHEQLMNRCRLTGTPSPVRPLHRSLPGNRAPSRSATGQMTAHLIGGPHARYAAEPVSSAPSAPAPLQLSLTA